MIDQSRADTSVLATLRADLIDFDKRNAVLRSDAIRLTNMVDSLMHERDYWRQRAEDAERKERAAMRLATSTEVENDTLRVTLAATRAELDRALTLAVEDRHKMAELERDIAIYEDNTDQSCP